MKIKEAFEPYLKYLKEKGIADKTIAEHKRFLYGALSHSIADIKISKLRLTDISKAIESGKEHGEYGSQRAVVTLRRLLKFIKESGARIPFDWREIEIPKVPNKPVEYLTDEELELIRGSLKTGDLAGLRTRALIEVLYDSGMRISEAISLNKDDIEWERKEAKVQNAKTKEIETVYFTERSLEWLKKYLTKRKDDLPALFVSGRGRLLSVTARNYLRTHTKHLGIKKHIRHHIFRKTLVTTLLQNNVDIKSVQVIARHKSERTTLRYYTGVDNERVKELHQKVMAQR